MECVKQYFLKANHTPKKENSYLTILTAPSKTVWAVVNHAGDFVAKNETSPDATGKIPYGCVLFFASKHKTEFPLSEKKKNFFSCFGL
jgi:hypothetical protein